MNKANNPNNRDNLVPLEKGSKRAKEIASAGGHASAKARKARTTAKASAQNALLNVLTSAQKKSYRKMGFDIPENEDVNLMDLGMARCLAKAVLKGDSKAMKDLVEMGGLHIDESKIIIDDISANQRPVIQFNLGPKPIEINAEIIEDIEIKEIEKKDNDN